MTAAGTRNAQAACEEKRIIKLGVLVSHPIQYFVPVYRALAKIPDIDLTVIYRTRVGVEAYLDPGFGQVVKWDVPLLDGYRSCFLSDKSALRGIEPGVAKELLLRRFDVLIVHGYNQLTNLVAIAVAKLIGTRVVIRGDTRLLESHLKDHAWKRFLKRILFKAFDGFLCIGTLNREYYAAFGAPAERILFAPFCVNNAAFSLEADDRNKLRLQYRTAIGLPKECVAILYASKLTKRKRPGDLLMAYAALAERYPNAWLVMAGSGEEVDSLKATINALGLERVLLIGFQNQSMLPSLYAASDVFVLPSEAEPWGLVLNEAMAAGLPVVVSDEVGAYPDLVRGQGVGVVYPCGDIEALTHALESLLHSTQARQEMGKKARVYIQKWDVDACVSAIASSARRLT